MSHPSGVPQTSRLRDVSGAVFCQDEDAGGGEEVWPNAVEEVVAGGYLLGYRQVSFLAMVLEVANGGEVYVGGVVPFPRERGGDGHSAAKGDLHAGAVVAQVYEAYDGLFADSEHLLEDEVGVLQSLDGLAEDDEVEGVVGEDPEALVHVDVYHRAGSDPDVLFFL